MSFPGTDRRPGERATMRMARGATAALVGALVAATALVGASAANAAPGPGTVSWSPPLAGEAVGVTVSGRTVRLAADREQPGPTRADGHGAGGTPGLLTLPVRHMDVPVDRVDAVLTLAAGSPGAAASVDVRGLRARGGWTEWEPGVPTPARRRPGASRPRSPSPSSTSRRVSCSPRRPMRGGRCRGPSSATSP